MSICINKKNNEAFLEIDTRLYDFDKIMESASEFTESCWIYLDGDPKEKITIKIKSKSNDINSEEAANEFYNFVLGLMKSKEEFL